ncbi:MAG TPA: hypothetical protein VHP36_01770 [Chitinispirillaceae bacterium]|nr:hypothetical protein [Chitinispirillaceae bacterium]
MNPMAMNTMGMDRMAMGMSQMPGMMMSGTMPMNMMMVPRCTMKMECTEMGMKIMCSTKDEMASAMMQNLCTMMSGSMMSCCMMMNGMPMMTINMTKGMCKCEMTNDGMCMTWCSKETECAMMIQQCCKAMISMMDCGCCSMIMMNGTPVCCSC